MSIWSTVQTALTPLAIPMAANMYLTATPDDLPDVYLVYFLVSSPSEQHMDDKESLRSYRMQVSVYSRSGLGNLPDVNGRMILAGFMAGPKTELPYNQQTRHYGLALEYYFLEEV